MSMLASVQCVTQPHQFILNQTLPSYILKLSNQNRTAVKSFFVLYLKFQGNKNYFKMAHWPKHKSYNHNAFQNETEKYICDMGIGKGFSGHSQQKV